MSTDHLSAWLLLHQLTNSQKWHWWHFILVRRRWFTYVMECDWVCLFILQSTANFMLYSSLLDSWRAVQRFLYLQICVLRLFTVLNLGYLLFKRLIRYLVILSNSMNYQWWVEHKWGTTHSSISPPGLHVDSRGCFYSVFLQFVLVPPSLFKKKCYLILYPSTFVSYFHWGIRMNKKGE